MKSAWNGTIQRVLLAVVVVCLLITICLFWMTQIQKHVIPRPEEQGTQSEKKENMLSNEKQDTRSNEKQDTQSKEKQDTQSKEKQDTRSEEKQDTQSKENQGVQNAFVTFNTSLERYKYLHKLGVENMSHPTGQRRVRTLTWACSLPRCSGIGDQLFRIEFALLLAVMSDRVFVIYWDEPLRKSTRPIPHNQINWDVFNSDAGICTDDGSKGQCNGRVYAMTSPYGFGWTEKEHERFGEVLFGPEQHITIVGNVFVNSMFIGDHSMMRVGKLMEEGFEKLGVTTILNKDRYNQVLYYRYSPYYIDLEKKGLLAKYEVMPMNNGRVQVTDAWQLLSHIIFHYLFRFSNDLLSQVEEIKTSLQLKTQPYLAVHMRTGFVGSPHEEGADFRNWLFKNWKLFDQSVWPCLLNHSINLADRLIGANSSVYLATDSVVVKEWAKKTYGTRVRMSSLVPSHSAKSNINSDDISSWIDLLLLGGSDVMVHGESSYGISAAVLTPIPIARQSWIHEDKQMGCMVSRIGNNATCIC